MKNSLGDLNNHLFAQLERLGDEDIKGDKLSEEIERSKAITQVATQIINNGKLVLDAIKAKDEYLGGDNKKMPAMLREAFVPEG
ncbi:hypothetical protein [Desulfosporosinus sp. FKA]|uniref:hypothetical protein n=1 Tax=Desulfosporosinus sp. FKA TaxID=1969834 RepID=UPI000B498099|nr:hypothetical protein [Desulfosporosinus sp. FKA]